MGRRSKKYIKAAGMVDRSKLYTLDEALSLLKNFPSTRFDETVDLVIKLGMSGKEVLRTTVVLPHQTGSSRKKILVFAKGEKVKEAQSAGADFVGAEDLAEKINSGWLDFDVAIATPEAMPVVVKLARILGPRGLMPNPRNETVTSDVSGVIKEIRSGRKEIKSDQHGIIQLGVAKISHSIQQIKENCVEVFKSILKVKPYVEFRSITLSSTMGPGIKIDPRSIKIVKE